MHFSVTVVNLRYFSTVMIYVTGKHLVYFVKIMGIVIIEIQYGMENLKFEHFMSDIFKTKKILI